jgi:hypothetical protein
MRHLFTNVAMYDNMHKGSYNSKILMLSKISKLCNKRYNSSCCFFEESTLLRCALKLSRWEYILNDLVWGYVPREGTTSYAQQCALFEGTTKGIISLLQNFEILLIIRILLLYELLYTLSHMTTFVKSASLHVNYLPYVKVCNYILKMILA